MADVFALLRTDHQEVEGILATLESGGGDHAALAEKLVIEESRHEAAEEMYFWPAVREKVAGGDALAERGIHQESEGKEVLDKLRKCHPTDAEFSQLVAKFAKAGREHIAFEQNEVWPKLEAALTPDERQELGDRYEAAKKAGPTRPHPNTPADPKVLKTAGAAAAVVDKAADAITGRGK